jgi:hypothetical protein
MADFTYLAFGAGRQTGMIGEMIIDGELPRVDAFIMADTGDEPQYVYDYATYMSGRCEEAGIPFLVVANGNMRKDLAAGKRFAAMPLFTVDRLSGKIGKLKRHCTNEYKIVPVERVVRELLFQRGLATRSTTKAGITRTTVKTGVRVEAWLGISLDEIERMKESRTPWIENRWPLIEKRLHVWQCLEWLKAHNHPIPDKSACIRCPFHSDAYFRDMCDNRPEDWHQVVDFDHALRDGSLRLAETAKGELYLHRSCQPIDQVDLRTLEELGQMMLSEICDEGYCGL